MLLCPGNTSNKQGLKMIGLSLVLRVQIFDKVIVDLRTTQTRNSTAFWVHSDQVALCNFNLFSGINEFV